jgi:hypothetical protein
MNLKQALKKAPPKHTIFDFCYDIKRTFWRPWRSVTLENYAHPISGDYALTQLEHLEVVRLNETARELFASKLSGLEEKQAALPPEMHSNASVFVHTHSSKLCEFFMQYFVPYRKPLLILGPYQNGLTTMVQHMRKQFMEYKSYTSFYLSVVHSMSIKRVIEIYFCKKISCPRTRTM